MYQKKEVVTCRCICLVIFVDVDDNDGRCFYEYSFAYVFLSVLLWRRIHARIVLCLIEVVLGALLLFQVFIAETTPTVVTLNTSVCTVTADATVAYN